ncbi:unnamed protein product, partial [Prorocentrum cordatum]
AQLSEVLHDWDHLVTQYELANHEKISDRLKCATILGYAPLPIRKVLDGASQEVREKNDVKVFAPKPTVVGGGSGAAPVQVGAVGSVDAIGFDKPCCAICKQLGHTAGKCWFGKGKSKDGTCKGGGRGGSGGGGAGRGRGSNPDEEKTCHYCKKKGHIELTCFGFRKGQEENNKGQVSLVEQQGEVEAIIVASDDDSDGCGFCMSLESYDDDGPIGNQVDYGFHDAVGDQVDCGFHDSIGDQLDYDGQGTANDQLEDEFLCRPCDDELVMAIGSGAKFPDYGVDEFLMLDGGSDEHCARRSFAKHIMVKETSSKLVAAQKQKISLDGESKVPFAMGGQVACRADFKIDPTARNLLSTRRVFDAGFDVVYSHSDGCFVSYTRPDGRCVKVPMTRKRYTFAVPASVRRDMEAADDYTTKQLMRFMKQLAYQMPELRCDTEAAVKALQDKVVGARRLKANRVQVEMNYGIKLTPHSPLWPFLAHHAANVTNWFSRGADGDAAYLQVNGVNYTGVVVPFAETVMARIPVSKTGQRRSMVPRLTKADKAWVKGIWVGKATTNDERVILTVAGKVTCRIVRRMPKGKRHDKELLLKVCGEPWKERIARMPRCLVMDGGKGEVVPTPLEAMGTEADGGRPRGAPEWSGGAEARLKAPRGLAGARSPTGDAVIGWREAKTVRVEDPIVGAVEDISEQLDYKTLLTAEELTHWDSSGFPMEEPAEAFDNGLKLCDEFGIYSVHPRGAADGKKKVDTNWGKNGRAGVLKYRLVDREFAWLEGDDGPDDPLVIAVGDVTSACYQVREKGEFYCDPPPGRLAARANAGLGVNVVWKLEKQLPGRRAASREWIGYAADLLLDCGLDRNEACPQFDRKPMTRLGLELHMGDLYCTGRKSDLESFLPATRAKLKLRDSDVVIEGRFEFLKRTRIKTNEGIFLQVHEKHSSNIIAELGLRGANPVRTPDLGPEETVEHSPPQVDKQVARYRSCVGSGLYLARDRADIQRAVGTLAASLATTPPALSWKRLLRLGRYLVGTSGLGVFLPKVDAKIYKKGVVHLRTFSDSDHGSKEAKRKSTTCGVLYADGVILATLGRRQDLIAVSSGESEFYALSAVAMGGQMLRGLLTWFGLRVRHLDTRSLWVQQATRLLNLKVMKCKGTENPADIGTKSHAAEVHEQLCEQVGLRHLGGDVGAVREVEVNAVIEKVARAAPGTRFGGKVSSSPALNAAILALWLAIQAQQGETVGDIGSEDDYGYMIVPMLVFLSWLVVFVMGCSAACCCSGGRGQIEPPPATTDSRSGVLVATEM